MVIDGLNFINIEYCPDKYNVRNKNGECVGYFYISDGILKCFFPEVNGELILYEKIGEKYTKTFQNDVQRKKYMTIIAEKIKIQIGNNEDKNE